MAEITMQAVKELRERTQAGMSDCKSALTEAAGDMEKAVEIILKKGLAKSAKRAGAVASEGEVRAALAADGKTGILVEVNIQTDFAARNDDFRGFVAKVAELALGVAEGSDLSAAPFDGAKTVQDQANELTGKIGEKIAVRRWAKFVSSTGLVKDYVHMGGKIGVLVEVDGPAKPELAKLAEDVAMQAAAMSPQFLSRNDVPADAVEKQKEIYKAQLAEENAALPENRRKPEAAWPKIIEGKVNKWFTEVCLLEQESVLEPGNKIEKVVESVAKAVGAPVSVVRFARFERGEGIEKKQDDFAAEVAKMAGN